MPNASLVLSYEFQKEESAAIHPYFELSPGEKEMLDTQFTPKLLECFDYQRRGDWLNIPIPGNYLHYSTGADNVRDIMQSRLSMIDPAEINPADQGAKVVLSDDAADAAVRYLYIDREHRIVHSERLKLNKGATSVPWNLPGFPPNTKTYAPRITASFSWGFLIPGNVRPDSDKLDEILDRLSELKAATKTQEKPDASTSRQASGHAGIEDSFPFGER